MPRKRARTATLVPAEAFDFRLGGMMVINTMSGRGEEQDKEKDAAEMLRLWH